ncbi:hypothetical protein BKA80DRAFT_264072 [Phyllosticta citrichinensis]
MTRAVPLTLSSTAGVGVAQRLLLLSLGCHGAGSWASGYSRTGSPERRRENRGWMWPMPSVVCGGDGRTGCGASAVLCELWLFAIDTGEGAVRGRTKQPEVRSSLAMNEG